ILEALHEAVAALPGLVGRLDGGAAPTADVSGISSRAHALAAGRGDGAPARPAPPAEGRLTEAAASATATGSAGRVVPIQRPAHTPPAESPGESSPGGATQAAPPTSPLPPAELAKPAEPGKPAEHAAGAAAVASAEVASVPTAMPADDTLRDIYARETAAHVATVRSYLARESGLAEPHALPEDVYRACHTLSGSSKMAQARHGTRLAEPLDHWLRRAYSSGIGLTTEELALLRDCMGAMEAVASHLDEPTGYFVNHWQLLERIERADRGLEQRIAAAAAHSAVQKAVAAVDGGAAAPAEAADEAADFDPEVAAIFTDEATELIDASEHALSDWRSQPSSAEFRLSLKRPLHTLKGGARMAGISPMGDLSHELESLVMLVDTGRVNADAALFEAIQASLDELARMREQVASGRRVAPARAMVARLQSLARPGGAPAEPPPSPAPGVPMPAAPAPAIAATSAPQRSDPVATAAPAAHEGPSAAPPAAAAPIPQPAVAEASAAGDTTLAKMNAELRSVHEGEQGDAAPVSAAELAAAPAGSPAEAAAVAGVLFARTRPPEAQTEEGLAAPQPVPPGREPVTGGERQEMARVDAELLDQLLNTSGEASIARARLEQQLGSLDFNLGELSRTVTRLKEQLRSLEIETEAQILHKHEEESAYRGDFDPLELDRYSSIQQYSRALAETANDVASIQQLLENLAKDTQTLLQQQARTITELQNGLMRTRMVPFQRHVQRLARIVRQAAADTGKRAELVVEGASGELDRQMLEHMLPPFEHMLRNAVVHGIEKPEERARRGKPDTGRITLELRREGAEVMVRLADDGSGMNLKAIRDKARSLGLIGVEQDLSDEEAMQLILEPGFSTAGSVTQQAGRGVGMDVVATEIKRLGGALHMETKTGEGTVFLIRLPLTLAISHALVVRTDEEYYALPLPTVEGVLRLSKAEVAAHLGRDAAAFEYGGQKYRFQHLANFVGLEASPLPEQDVTIPVVLVRAGEHSTGLVADELVGSREIVVKSVGPQISGIRGISGATILGDGRIVIILDIGAL
ncbi:MAG: chemotaxis protein CheA, partial [Gammaproteobacteria bacterium]|nr:chemotaxis protein CheA [Gammaproteobacteria bacterium]